MRLIRSIVALAVLLWAIPAVAQEEKENSVSVGAGLFLPVGATTHVGNVVGSTPQSVDLRQRPSFKIELSGDHQITDALSVVGGFSFARTSAESLAGTFDSNSLVHIWNVDPSVKTRCSPLSVCNDGPSQFNASSSERWVDGYVLGMWSLISCDNFRVNIGGGADFRNFKSEVNRGGAWRDTILDKPSQVVTSETTTMTSQESVHLSGAGPSIAGSFSWRLTDWRIYFQARQSWLVWGTEGLDGLFTPKIVGTLSNGAPGFVYQTKPWVPNPFHQDEGSSATAADLSVRISYALPLGDLGFGLGYQHLGGLNRPEYFVPSGNAAVFGGWTKSGFSRSAVSLSAVYTVHF